MSRGEIERCREEYGWNIRPFTLAERMWHIAKPIAVIVAIGLVLAGLAYWDRRENASQRCVNEHGLTECIRIACARAATDRLEAARCEQWLPYRQR